MSQSSGPGSSEEARRAIEELNLSREGQSARIEHHWSAAEEEQAVRDYRGFLWLCHEYPDVPFNVLPPSADHVWHEHIVNTRKYARDCEMLFGRFLDHVPFDPGQDPDHVEWQKAVDRTEREICRSPLRKVEFPVSQGIDHSLRDSGAP